MSADSWLSEVRERVETRLAEYFEHREALASALAPEAPELVRAVRELTLRGGKRFRPALAVAAFRAVAPDRDTREVVDAGAALELLQTYLLIHDDWMDRDDERRGGPSVHVALEIAHNGDAHLAANLAILAGNLASAQAWDLLLNADWPSATKDRAVAAFLATHHEVVFGQQLDLLANADVSRISQLKTGSYTVRGPLLLGAALADAQPEQRDALIAFGRPLGEAFQMRDDLLGTFGDRERTGKSVGTDLRADKRTALLMSAEALARGAQRAAIEAVRGNPNANGEALHAARAALIECGAKAAVEGQLRELLTQANESLDGAPISDVGRGMLIELAAQLAVRDA